MEIEDINDMLQTQELETNMPGRLFKGAKAALIASRQPFGIIASCLQKDGSPLIFINGNPIITFGN